jgi:NAD(P)H-dependent flavin oxidoreductase YrpB (nitropropane dioxygenase family)
VLTTDLTRRLGIEAPIFSAGMGGGLAGPELVAAVSNAGGLGVLGMLALPAALIREHIRRVRALTPRPFGVNLVLPALQGDEVDVCLAERVPVLVLFWGDPSPYVADAHRHGTFVISQIGSVAEACAATEAGVDALMVQGVEAGGHVRGTTSLLTLLPSVASALRSIGAGRRTSSSSRTGANPGEPPPLIAAGGIADGRGLSAALGLGAQAVSMGTRFLASEEAGAAPAYKARVVAAKAEDTVYTSLFDIGWPDAPHRVLRNGTVDAWERAGRPAAGARPGEGDVVGRVPIGGMTADVVRYSVVPPLAGFDGDLEDVALYAGESCALIDGVKPAAAIVRDVLRETEAILRDRK